MSNFLTREGLSAVMFEVTDEGSALSMYVMVDGKRRAFGTDAVISEHTAYSSAVDLVVELAGGTQIQVSAKVVRWAEGT